MLFPLLNRLMAMEFKALEATVQLCPSGGRALGGSWTVHFSAGETEVEHHSQARNESGQGPAWAAPWSPFPGPSLGLGARNKSHSPAGGTYSRAPAWGGLQDPDIAKPLLS